jgi:hypothetical protein
MEDGPLSRIGFEAYMTPVVPDDCVRNRKPHAAPVRLGGEIGIEYFLKVRLRDSGAGVAHRDPDIPASGQWRQFIRRDRGIARIYVASQFQSYQ